MAPTNSKNDPAEDRVPTEPLGLYERLRFSLLEDYGPLDGRGDVTSRSLVPDEKRASGRIIAKKPGVLCGVNLLSLIFRMAEEVVSPQARGRLGELDKTSERAGAGEDRWDRVQALCEEDAQSGVSVKVQKKDGERLMPGDVISVFSGNARALLFGERTALNLLGRLSGVASLTAQFVERIKGTRAQILDTRKTTPLWRDLEKYAVGCGGGVNHRIGLYDMVLIKENHLALWGSRDVAGAVNAARARYPNLRLEIEVTDLLGLASVCQSSEPDFILLDNFEPAAIREAVQWCDKFYAGKSGQKSVRPLLEASGGITLENVRAYADAGVDRISVGAVTHSAEWFDVSLLLDL